MANSNTKDLKELQAISLQLKKFQKRLDVLKTRIKGEDMDEINALAARLSRALDVIKSKSQGAVAVAEVVAALTPIVTKAEADAGITGA